ncbi:hypothetical protein ACIBJI_23650 [Nocardia sp. NPDC050408]|uniref:hypothetical protein n=1 Tax=Nocardia sp. NPDC050408 TaxID=3364319 RepID=UPI0037B878D8
MTSSFERPGHGQAGPRRHCNDTCRQLAYRKRVSAGAAAICVQTIDWNLIGDRVRIRPADGDREVQMEKHND